MYFECLENLKKNVKIKNKFKNRKIEYFDFGYFYIRNFEIPKYRQLYIWSFQILIPTRLRSLEYLWAVEWLGIHDTEIFKNLVDKNEYDKSTLIPALQL